MRFFKKKPKESVIHARRASAYTLSYPSSQFSHGSRNMTGLTLSLEIYLEAWQWLFFQYRKVTNLNSFRKTKDFQVLHWRVSQGSHQSTGYTRLSSPHFFISFSGLPNIMRWVSRLHRPVSNRCLLGGFAVLSLMTHGAIEKVMLRTATSYNATAYVNHTLDELIDMDNDTIISNSTLMQ